MHSAYIALGSNLGDRLAWLQLAVDGLKEMTETIQCSPVYESAAHTLRLEDQFPDFLNAVVEVDTDVPVGDLLDYCQSLEHQAKRQRNVPYGPRTLDVDLLSVGQVTCNTKRIILPHPRLMDRKFVLQPWCDLAPKFMIPYPIHLTVSEALECCQDDSRLEKTPYQLAMGFIPENQER